MIRKGIETAFILELLVIIKGKKKIINWSSRIIPRYFKQMVKQKPRLDTSKNQQGDWTLVKKQKITIIIPPLPKNADPAADSIGEGRLQENPGSSSTHSSHKTQKSKSLSPKRATHPPSNVHPCKPNLTFQKPSGFSSRIASDNNPPLYGECKGENRSFLDRRMRASFLEKKIKRAGGLENWLVSIGLGHFGRFFRTRRASRFHLANLTMEELKEMGMEAVGPRRKLLHAIGCLCEPLCFQQHV